MVQITMTPGGKPQAQAQRQYTAEQLSTLRRCKRCKVIYTMGDTKGTECRYHPGRYVNGSTSRLMGYTCCKQFRSPGSDTEPAGCKVSHCHREDRTFQNAIASFPYQAPVAPPAAPPAEEVAVGEKGVISLGGEGTSGAAKVVNKNNYVMHTVTKYDTLMGIALRYDSKPEKILKFNNLYYEQAIYERGFLFIPDANADPNAVAQIEMDGGEPDMKDGILQQFCARASCRQEVAKFYLEDNEWDLDDSMRAWREDEDWNRQQELSRTIVAQPIRHKRSRRACCVF